MRRLFTAFLLAIIWLSSCNSDEGIKRQPTELVNLAIVPGSLTENDFWLMASDQNGNIIAQKKWAGESNLSISAEVFPDDRINVIMFYASNGNSPLRTIRVYANVLPARKWRHGVVSENDAIGLYTVKWNDIPTEGVESYNIAGLQNEHLAGFGSNCTVGTVADCNGTYKLYEDGAESVFCFIRGNNTPYYFKTDTLVVGQEYEYDFNTVFKPFDNVLQLTGEANASFVLMYVAGVTGQQISGQSWYGPVETGMSNVKLGYNNGFDQYLARVESFTASKAYSWVVYKSSLQGTDFQIPATDFTIDDNSFTNYTFHIDWDKAFEYQKSEWHQTVDVDGTPHYINVELYGEHVKGSDVLNALPDEVLLEYPEVVNFKSGVLKKAEFYFSEAGLSHDEMIEKYFDDDTAPELRTTYRITRHF